MKSNVWYARGYSARVKDESGTKGTSLAFFKNDRKRYDAYCRGATQAILDFDNSRDPDHQFVLVIEKENWEIAHDDPYGDDQSLMEADLVGLPEDDPVLAKLVLALVFQRVWEHLPADSSPPLPRRIGGGR